MTESFFGPAFVDIDEWRDAPMRHRYVHGGFEGTDTRFSYYFPPADQWQGRFLQTLEGGNGGHENTAQSGVGTMGGIAFAVESGAYLVESNQGHIGSDLSIMFSEPTVHAYRASAHSARYSRELAAEMYGAVPHHGYVFGGSGGSARVILCLENCPDVWQGAVPFITGHASSWSLGFSVQAHAARLLGPKIASVIDAVEPGGSGDPFAGLSSEQRDALAAMYRAGFPRGAESSFGTSGYAGTFASHISALEEFDPTYIDEFWSVPGYMGADGELATSLLEDKTPVTRLVSGTDLAALARRTGEGGLAGLFAAGAGDTPVGVVLDGMDPKLMIGAAMRIVTGEAAGRKLFCTGTVGDVLLGAADITERFESVASGDEVLVDNREYLAYTYFHRYQVDPVAPEYRQFRVDGRAVHPQRDRDFSRSGLLSGANATGRFDGKMIVVQNAHDAACWPNAAIAFRREVEAHHGDALADHYRLWFNEHAAHLPASFNPPGSPPVATTRLTDYGGSLEQALRDLMAWVEDEVEPPRESGYTLDDDQRLTLAADASDRGGVQPVVRATANDAIRADVTVGSSVRLAVDAEAPPGGGSIVGVEWDFDGTGAFPFGHDSVDGSQRAVHLEVEHRFDAPGTYFPCVRVTAHRDGDLVARHCRLVNLGRVRVVVS
jgi:Tannase and feruloyl esterase